MDNQTKPDTLFTYNTRREKKRKREADSVSELSKAESANAEVICHLISEFAKNLQELKFDDEQPRLYTFASNYVDKLQALINHAAVKREAISTLEHVNSIYKQAFDLVKFFSSDSLSNTRGKGLKSLLTSDDMKEYKGYIENLMKLRVTLKKRLQQFLADAPKELDFKRLLTFWEGIDESSLALLLNKSDCPSELSRIFESHNGKFKSVTEVLTLAATLPIRFQPSFIISLFRYELRAKLPFLSTSTQCAEAKLEITELRRNKIFDDALCNELIDTLEKHVEIQISNDKHSIKRNLQENNLYAIVKNIIEMIRAFKKIPEPGELALYDVYLKQYHKLLDTNVIQRATEITACLELIVKMKCDGDEMMVNLTKPFYEQLSSQLFAILYTPKAEAKISLLP